MCVCVCVCVYVCMYVYIPELTPVRGTRTIKKSLK